MSQHFTEFVFFLSTAEEEAGMFNAQEQSPAPHYLRYRRDLLPGTYRLDKGHLEVVEFDREDPLPEAADSSSESWCTGWVQI